MLTATTPSLGPCGNAASFKDQNVILFALYYYSVKCGADPEEIEELFFNCCCVDEHGFPFVIVRDRGPVALAHLLRQMSVNPVYQNLFPGAQTDE